MSKHSQRIFVVVTSHADLGDTGKKTGVWLEELASPYYEFSDRGYEVQLASPKGGQPPIDPKSQGEEWRMETTGRFLNDSDAMNCLEKTLPLSQAKASNYDAIYLAGGHGPMWDYPSEVPGADKRGTARASYPTDSGTVDFFRPLLSRLTSGR